jgi:uncharacterized membrane protein
MLMMSHIRARWEHIRTSFWFIPALMAILGSLFAELMLAVDQRIPDLLLYNQRLVISAGASEQRAILLGLAGATVGTAGVVFTLATVPLSVAASQFGSRLLRTFLSDPLCQIVMGCFTATVVYCISVSLSIPASSQPNQLPFLATTASVVLFGVSFGSVIFLIHHLGVMLQAPVITHRIGRFLNRAIRTYTRQRAGTKPITREEADLRDVIAVSGEPILARRSGYVDVVDGRRLVHLARRHGVVVELRALPGAFVMEGEALALAWPAAGLTPKATREIGRCYLMGVQRSLFQDVGFGINQLIEIALRALSPAINDPLTAMSCLDRIGDSLRLLAAGEPPPTLLRDGADEARVFLTPAGFAELAEAGLSPIRQYGCESAMVLQRLVDVIEGVVPYARRPEDCAALARHLELVAETGEAGLPTECERRALRDRLEAVADRLQAAPAALLASR